MKKFACILLVLLMFFTLLNPVSAAGESTRTRVFSMNAADQDQAEELLLKTDYQGYYTSRNGRKGLTLTFYRDGYTGELRAIFFFYPSYDADWLGDYFSGAYTMKVHQYGDDFELIADEWIDIGNHFEQTVDGWVETAADLTMINLYGTLSGNTLSGETNYGRPFEVTAAVQGDESHSLKSPFTGSWGELRDPRGLTVQDNPLSCGAAIEQDESGKYRIMVVSHEMDAASYAAEMPLYLTSIPHVNLAEDIENPVTFSVSCGMMYSEICGLVKLDQDKLVLDFSVSPEALKSLTEYGLRTQYELNYLGDFRLEASRVKALTAHPVQGMEYYVVDSDKGDRYMAYYMDGQLIFMVIEDNNMYFAGKTEVGSRFLTRDYMYPGVQAKQVDTFYTLNFPYVNAWNIDEYTVDNLGGTVYYYEGFPPIEYPEDTPSGEEPSGGEEDESSEVPSRKPENDGEAFGSIVLDHEYIGYYTTRHGQKGLTLVFYQEPYTGKLKAIFSFYPSDDPNWKGEDWSGSFSMKVIEKGNHYELIADEWIDYPGDLELIDLYGVLYNGKFSGVSNYGRYFEVME